MTQSCTQTIRGLGAPTETTMLQTFLKVLFAVVTGGSASAEECSGSITAEEVLRAEDTR